MISSAFISGIGNALVKALATGGAETIALSRTQEDLDKLKAEVGPSLIDPVFISDDYVPQI